MKKEWKHPFWENYQKDRITAKLIITHDDGKVTSSTAKISKYLPDGSVSKDFEEIIKQNTLEVIDKNTQDREDRHKQRRKADKQKQDERRQADLLAELFNTKLEVFEIEDIKNSKNRRMKSKIRKAKNKYEMMAYVVMLLQEEMNKENEST